MQVSPIFLSFKRGIWLFHLKKILKFKSELWLNFIKEGLILEELYALSQGDKNLYPKYAQLFLSYPSILKEVMELKHHQHVETQLKQLKFPLEQYDYIDYSDTDYPKQLKELKNAPLGLFTLSSKHSFRRLKKLDIVAVVGSRKASAYGLRLCEDIVKCLIHQNILVMSGLALGIDAAAHFNCIKRHAPTLAILAHGFEHLYPPENKDLFQKILETGILMSEYPPFEEAQRYKFRERNRIMSGLSQKIVIPEAAAKSGTLLTATYASEQGRELWVCPSSLYAANSYGANQLIQEGANILYDLNQFSEIFVEDLEKTLLFEMCIKKNKSSVLESLSEKNEILNPNTLQHFLLEAQKYQKVFQFLKQGACHLNELLDLVEAEDLFKFKSFFSKMLFYKYIDQRKNQCFLTEKGENFMRFCENYSELS